MIPDRRSFFFAGSKSAGVVEEVDEEEPDVMDKEAEPAGPLSPRKLNSTACFMCFVLASIYEEM